MFNRYYYDHLTDEQTALLEPMYWSTVLAGGVHHHTKGAFSGRVMWADMIRRSPELLFRGWAPSPIPEEIPRHANVCQAKRHGITVSHRFGDLVRQNVETHGPDHTLACIAVDTKWHRTLIEEAVEAGARFIWCDKPLVVGMEDYAALLRLCQAKPNVRVFVAQNHRFCSAALLLRHRAQEALKKKKKVQVRSGFWQAWLLGDQESVQAVGRLNDIRCTLSDLGAHCFDLIEFILGLEALVLKKGTGLHGLLEKFPEVFTGGTCELAFADANANGSIDVNQCKKDALMDDLWTWLKIDGEKDLLWRMGWNGGDSVFAAR
ncbi:MAG: hypothetical protein PHI23_02650, partial [Candidatus Peribacteraceae bacterium]|nr:hypothetical protein [Candidatus Peribacteraceae bacterium]